MNSLLLTDGYKTGHHQQYPEGTVLVYSNFTPRSLKYAPKGAEKIVSFGQQMVMQQLHDHFEQNFFKKPKAEVISEMKEELSMYLGYDYDTTHFEKLHDLGYLPIVVKSIPEGERIAPKIPLLTIYNTDPDFYWVTNYLETILSNLLWKPVTSATIAYQYRQILKKWAEKTDPANLGFIDFQGHDFSMRGMDSIDAVVSSGLGHLTSFKGTDSLPTIWGARKYYGETGFVAGSVPATEHSTMSAGSKENEINTFRRLLKIYPKGILSVVSDTWDLWKVLTEYLPQLKEQILARDGKLVIRPDSSDPVDIICGLKTLNTTVGVLGYINDAGDYESGQYQAVEVDNKFYSVELVSRDQGYPYFKTKKEISQSETKGVIELLWDVFGGTINEQGYKVLDPHIGAIYGDSITIDRADQICKRLEAKGFASTNIVLGVGSFTYQYNTRDSFSMAQKSTYIEIEEEFLATPESVEWGIRKVGHNIYKDPITDGDGTKKSAKGLLKVVKENGEYKLIDQIPWSEEREGELQVIYSNGEFFNQTTLTDIRNKLM